MLNIIAEDASLSAKLMKSIKKLTAQKQDPTLMTEEESFAKIEQAGHDIAETKNPGWSFPG